MGFVVKEAFEEFRQARIKVVGVGGGGCNAVNRLVELGLNGVEIIGINSDHQALEDCSAPIKVQLGDGLGAGSDPDRGRELALESKDRIKEVLSGADMVFVAASMGGGTGTGGAPVVAQIAKEQGAIVIGVVTKPSAFEGTYKIAMAERGIEQLAKEVNSLILISNQKLLNIVEEDTLLEEALQMTSDILVTAVRSVLEPLLVPGMVNVDFADLQTVMSHRGLAIMGIG
ncbi:MAG TPA: cell division protein FtsZ, partial [Proteobacteria bacterium]|nr:cell division protein FtsZ [Pseudomonadota bacterium]